MEASWTTKNLVEFILKKEGKNFHSHTQKFGFGQSTQTFWNANLSKVGKKTKKGGNKPWINSLKK